jgi:hypothetical protein
VVRRVHARRATRRRAPVLSDYDVIVPGAPAPGEWLQQATLAIRARVPLDILRDTIQPFPTFSEIYADALKALHAQLATVSA